MTITSIINEVTKLATSFIFWFPATFIFIALISMILTAGNPEKRKDYGSRISWIIIGAFVLLSIGGIIAVLNQTFFAQNAVITAPPGGTVTPSATPAQPSQPATPGSGASGSGTNCVTLNGQQVCQ